MKVEPSSPSEVDLTLAVVSNVLMIEMAAFALRAQAVLAFTRQVKWPQN
jgi:hypothetical protein